MPLVPSTADDWCAWARFEHQEGRMDRAEAGFRRALALDSSSLAGRFGLASLLLDNGSAGEAAAVATRMASDASDRPEVLWLQARLASCSFMSLPPI
jgi:Tfp pilus assembly protein PilF